ncbi:MAG: hypothetical protein JWQ78_759 [Sediminibacterium sp.]|nr:hypothetical protein [Sediminibacterium sp.]
MKQLLLLLLLITCGIFVRAQSDLLVLKQRNRTIQTWIPGSFIDFQFSSKQWIQGIIKAVRNDSVIIEQVMIVQVPNRFGFPTIDTAKMGLFKLHVNEIYGMPKRNFNNGILSNGTLFQLGSGAFVFLNVFNSLIHNEQVFSSANLSKIGVGGSVFLAGSLLHAGHRTYITLGKKYSMRTVHLNRQP